MSEKAKTFEEAAIECAAKISDEQKRYFQLHIDYSHHHFGYGLYLRNQYFYLLQNTTEYIDRDSIGSKIYYLMLPIIFPEFKGYEDSIERITFSPLDQLNAHYFLKYGRNFISDVLPDEYFNLPDRSEIDDCDFDDWWNKYETENKNYEAAIAAKIWDIENFSKTAHTLGYSPEEIEEVHNVCLRLLKEKYLFVPLEILFAKKASAESIAAMMEQKELFEYFFSTQSSIDLLPDYVFKNRDMALLMVSARGSLLEYLHKFKSDRELVITAIRKSVYACNYMDKSFWGDVEIAEEAAKNSRADLMFSYDSFKQFNDDDRIVKMALDANGANICYTSERIRSDYNMAKFALQHQREIYPYSAFPSLSDELRNCKELAVLEIASVKPSLDGFSDELLDDDDIAELLIIDEDKCRHIDKMSERIKRKYIDRMPENIQAYIKRELHIEE